MSENTTAWPDAVRIMPEGLWAWTMPVSFSQGWVCGPFLFVGGQIATDEPGVALAPGDIEGQTRIVFENIKKVLDDAGTGFDHVVKFNTFYVFDGADDELQAYWEKMTRVRLEFLPNPGPAGTAVRVSGLAYPGLLLEVEAIAYDPALVRS